MRDHREQFRPRRPIPSFQQLQEGQQSRLDLIRGSSAARASHRQVDLTLLGAPVLPGRAIDKILQEKISDLGRAINRLSLLQAHDALCLLKNSIAMPKLLYVLRTSPCFDNPLLASFDDTLRRGLSLVLNVKLSDSNGHKPTYRYRWAVLG